VRCFIAGTDTGVGKTFFTSILLRNWVRHGHRSVGFKPISSGTRDDAIQLQQAAGSSLSLDEINPYHLQQPLSPWISAGLENRKLSIKEVSAQILKSSDPFTHVAVEGAGGWMTPVNSRDTMGDLARELGFPVIIVTRTTLGTLNHTFLTIESIRTTGLPILGLVINHHGASDNLAAQTNPQAMADFTGLPYIILERDQPAPSSLPSWLESGRDTVRAHTEIPPSTQTEK